MNTIAKIPKVSVLMPAYNAELYISEAIESILNQTFIDFEFIIIDDCSTDNTLKIINKYALKDKRIKVLTNQTNSKICITLNKGLKVLKGKYVARMDADDWSFPDRLMKQVAFMDENPEIVISGGTMTVCDHTLSRIKERHYNLTDTSIRKNLFRYSPFCHPSTIFKAEFAKTIDGYDTAFVSAEDYDFYFRIGQLGKYGNLTDILLKLRTNAKSVSQSQSRKQEKLTLKIRRKAVKVYGYKMTNLDKIYNICQHISLFLIPQKLKFKLFNFIRN